MEILQKPILIIDCQTTGTHPKNGHLLQIGWSVFCLANNQSAIIEKWVLQLPADYEIPPKIMAMQHLCAADLYSAADPLAVFQRLQNVLASLGAEPIVVAHYAQFEHAFLKAFYLEHSQQDVLNFTLLCSQKLAKRLIPNLPSYNLKGLAGYLQMDNSPKNEVTSHVQMTLAVWKHLQSLCIEKHLTNFPSLISWLHNSRPLKPTGYDYHIERLSRLNLSAKPGVYFMRAKDESILYIGKATSLQSRVNSYFRGIKKPQQTNSRNAGTSTND